MKKIITIIAALSAIGLASPAVAQSRYGNDNAYGFGNGFGIEARIDQLRQRLQFGVQRGTISRQEAVYLRDGFRQLNRLERHYSRGGLSRGERQDLQLRIQQLQRQIQAAERSRDRRYDDRDGRDWDDNRGDRDDNRRWDDRNGDDRRWDDDRRDRDD